MGNQEHPPLIMKGQNTSVIEDTYLLAALLTFDPHISYYPICSSSGRVSFVVKGKVADKIGRLFAGEEAPLEAYIRNLKTLRSAIFALKNTHKHEAVPADDFDLRDAGIGRR